MPMCACHDYTYASDAIKPNKQNNSIFIARESLCSLPHVNCGRRDQINYY